MSRVVELHVYVAVLFSTFRPTGITLNVSILIILVFCGRINTFRFISNNGGIIGHVIDQQRITTSEESKVIVAIHAIPALAAGATPLLTVSTVPPGRAASIRVSTRLMCSTVACVCKTLLLFRWVRSWKWGRNRRWSRRW